MANIAICVLIAGVMMLSKIRRLSGRQQATPGIAGAIGRGAIR
jgi:hypothetical protein